MDSVLAPYNRLNQQLLWVAVVGLLIATGLAFFVARGLTRSVRDLATASQRIAAG